MITYFANNGNVFSPSKEDTNSPRRDTLSGKLEACNISQGNSMSGYWLIFWLRCGNETIKVFFDYNKAGNDVDLASYQLLVDHEIKLGNLGGKPVIEDVIDVTVASVRTILLHGVAWGHITMNDLPVLMDFFEGKHVDIEMWNTFKGLADIEGLEAVKKTIQEKKEMLETEIKEIDDDLKVLNTVYNRLEKEISKERASIEEAIVFLQGEDSDTSHLDSENMVLVSEGYGNLMDAMQKFKSRKGIYVLCRGELHRIHHAFLEEKGRVFLLGSSREYHGITPEALNEIINNNPNQ